MVVMPWSPWEVLDRLQRSSLGSEQGVQMG